ncbi:MAG: hypothetical protein J1E59_09110, partial [Treponema sp.]|nr:hypothetical protein [Treponema sp.]
MRARKADASRFGFVRGGNARAFSNAVLPLAKIIQILFNIIEGKYGHIDVELRLVVREVSGV